MSNLRCQARRGVLTLSACGEAADAVCQACTRPTCPRHLSDQPGPLCLACAVSRTEKARDPLRNEPAPRNYDDPAWVYAFGNWYDSRMSQRHWYNAGDRRGFDRRHGDDDLPPIDPGSSLLDS